MQEESTLGSAGEPNALTETVKVLRECMKASTTPAEVLVQGYQANTSAGSGNKAVLLLVQDQAGALEVKVPVDQLLVCLQYLSQHGPREVEMGVGSQTHIAEDAGGGTNACASFKDQLVK
jgi:hypothetical protein